MTLRATLLEDLWLAQRYQDAVFRADAPASFVVEANRAIHYRLEELFEAGYLLGSRRKDARA
jgi:hypothetical protein